MEIGKYISELRNEKGLSQRKLAELSGVSNTEISRIESGERKKVSPEILKALAPHLGVSYEKLMEVAGYITITSTPTLAAHRINGYDEPLTDDEIIAVNAFLEAYRKGKQSKKD